MKILAFALLAISLLPTKLWAVEKDAIHMVVQQNGQALVSEVRPLPLPNGSGTFALPNLPGSLIANTLQVRAVSPSSLVIQGIAQNDGILNSGSLLHAYLGKQVTIVVPDGKTRDGRIQKAATVLSTQEPAIFLVDGQVYCGPVDAILYPGIPAALNALPQVSFDFINTGPALQKVDISYMTGEIGWSMDYVLRINNNATSGLLSGWITLTNKSGKDFDKASVALLAGDPNSVATTRDTMSLASPAMARAVFKAGNEIEESTMGDALFEYHIYHLKHPVNLADNQSRRVELFKSATVPLTRKLLGTAQALPYNQPSEPIKQTLEVMLSFRNTEASGLGLALPKGTLRAIQEDDGARYALGTESLSHIPVGAPVNVRLGKVFDVNVERVMTEYEKTGKNSYRVTWELHVTNAKKQAQRVTLQEQIPGKWKVESASQKWTKASAGALEFEVNVPPTGDGEPFALKYTFSTER